MSAGDLLNTIIIENIFAFLLIFTRIGTAVMLMPGIGDSFISTKIRLFFVLAISFVMTPILMPHIPAIPNETYAFAYLIMTELFIGIFIGTVMRILLTALDTAGMMIAMQAGFANAQIFNPVLGGQGSLPGTLLTLLGILIIFATNMHHLLITSVFESYNIFPANGEFLDTGSTAEVISRSAMLAYKTGFQFAIPFFIMGLIVYLGFGLLGRLMPQIQVFFLALPLQIILGLITLSIVFPAGMLFWLAHYESAIINLLNL